MSFITNLTRAYLTRTLKPFTFKNEYDQKLPFSECEGLGLYVHIPFCKSICNFCPYCKVRHSRELCDRCNKLGKLEFSVKDDSEQIKKIS